MAILAILFGSIFAISPALSQVPAGPRLPETRSLDPVLAEKLAKRGDLTLADTPMAETLLRVAEIWGVNLVVGQEVQGRVTGAFRNSPLSEILDAILLSNGYGYRPVGESLVVMKLESLGDLNPMFEVTAIRLSRCLPSELAATLQLLCSPKGRVQPLDPTSMLVVVDYADRARTIQRLAIEMDELAVKGGGPADAGQLDMAHFAPQFAKAAALKESVTSLLSKDGKTAVLEPENRLVVMDHPENLALVDRLVRELDFPRNQVRITALIYDVATEDMERLGVNWSHALKYRPTANGVPRTLFAGATVLDAVPAAGAANGVMTLMNLSQNVDLTAVVQALHTCDDARLLANPNVTVLDNEPATISIVTEIPYQQLTQTQQGGNIGTTAFREAGVKLEVTPRIALDGTIQMQVSPSFSRLTGYTPGDQPQPIIDRREAKTAVRVLDGQTLVIGGLRLRQEITGVDGIPYLEDIKILGNLFKSRDENLKESELIVFIRPELVTPENCGLARERAAAGHAEASLDGIPPACDPQTPVEWTPPLAPVERSSYLQPPLRAPRNRTAAAASAPAAAKVAPQGRLTSLRPLEPDWHRARIVRLPPVDDRRR